jgi:hypothetical protein
VSTSLPPTPGVEGPPAPAAAFRIGTRASTMAEFVEAFCRFADDDSIFLPVAQPLPIGRRLSVRVTLVDGTTVLGGEVEVIESVGDRGGAFGRNGMRVRLLRVGEATRGVHQSLLARRQRLAPRGPLPGVAPALGEGSKVGVPTSAAAVAAIRELTPARGMVRPKLDASIAMPATGTLPANPLAALSAEALESFVDCALFDDDAADFDGGDTAVDARLPIPEGIAQAVAPPRPTPPPLPPLDAGEPGPMRRAFTSPPGAVPVPIAPTTSSPVVRPAMLLDTPFTTRSVKAIDVAAEPMPAPEPPPPVELAPPRRRGRILLILGATAAVGLGLAWIAVRGDATAPAPAPLPARTEVPAAVPAVAPAPPPVAPEPPAAPAAPAAAESTSCRLSVITDRPGASASVDGRSLGVTPVEDAEVDCHGTLVLEHPRYQRVERKLALEPGQPGKVEESLARPTVVLTVRSTPPGADVLLDGDAVGVTPMKLTVTAFEHSTLELSLHSYKVWSQPIYLKSARALDVALEPAAKPKATPKPRAR